MGDAKKRSKKFVRPPMQWNAERIKEEGDLRKEFGLKNAREVWKAKAELRRIRGNARKLLAAGDKGTNETEQILKRVERYGFLKKEEGKENTLDDLLQLDVRSILERRLQTRVMKKGLAVSAKQARQLITHGFIAIDGVKISVPSYLVPLNEDDRIDYYKKIEVTPKIQKVETPNKVEKEHQHRRERAEGTPKIEGEQPKKEGEMNE